MKLIIEDSSNRTSAMIKINKYLISDFILEDWGVRVIIEDHSAGSLRLPPRFSSGKIKASQISRVRNYLYIPADQIPSGKVPGYLSQKEMKKKDWGELKTLHPYYK